MKINQIISTITIALLAYCSITEGFADKTHKSISDKAIIYSQADAYIKNQMDLSPGLGTMLLLEQGVIPAGERIPYAQFEARINPELPSNPCSILNFLKAGANLEDVPNPRARHHFHAPIANPGVAPPNPNNGLDNRTDHPYWADTFDFWTGLIYGLSFDLTGASAQLRAVGTEGAQWETEYLNYYAWPDTRTYFYRALTKSTLAQRNHYLALTFISLGQTVHLLEDMGVPAHTRNDFVYGHMMLMDITPNTWGKNPFEYWVEKQIRADNNNIPSGWLTGWTPQAKVFDKISKYWDMDAYSGTYVGLPLSSWGLAEQTNYQFYSTSTGPGCAGTLYQFPNPSMAHLGNNLRVVEPNGVKLFYDGSNYGVLHIARMSYMKFYADKHGITHQSFDNTITPDDVNVYQDYVRVTIPRTIDYVSGLLNYFFRGKFSVTASCSNAECDTIEIYITNQSVNTNVNQTLKGGSFGLYWDDDLGNRTQVSGLTVFDSNDSGNPNLWGPSKTLAKGDSIRATFNKPSSSVAKYTLVYNGSISANPNDPDPNDVNAIAVCMFNPPSPPGPSITNITPVMGVPGSILLIEGDGFAGTPSNNTVLFDDVNTSYPNVYGTVTEADSNGKWLKVELPVFDAEGIEYYWANTTVTVDSNTSDPYPFQLTNYIWCTVYIWDCGSYHDDDFDVYLDGEYWFTTVFPPWPEEPMTGEFGFWYENDYIYLDIYLYDSYIDWGGTLGVLIEPYVTEVVANRWNDASQQTEFLFDNDYDGVFFEEFLTDVLTDVGDGVEMDVYAFPTYTGDLGSSGMAAIMIPRKGTTIGKGERLRQFGPIDTSSISVNKDIPRKRIEKRTSPQRIRTKDRVRIRQ
ncbi:MAG: IPT/TIG domain-containing protein [Sedimentisphaerales bacterium]|nr:IPT/TIG domain-containing protein [Sedimentisphaerales bacterium]